MRTTSQTKNATLYDGPNLPNPVLVNPFTCVLAPFCKTGLEPVRRGYCEPCWEEVKADYGVDPCDLCSDPVKYHSARYGNLCSPHYYKAYREDKHPDRKFYQQNRDERKEQVRKWQRENPGKLSEYHHTTYRRQHLKRRARPSP